MQQSNSIRINAVGPVFINTPLLSGLSHQVTISLIGLHPMERLGEPPEVAGLVVWLNPDKASFVNSSYYPVDGGYLIR